MNKLYITLILTFTGLASFAQASQSDMVFPKFRIGITPSAILNSHPAIQLSFDRRLSKKWNLSLESGFIFTSIENAKGFRLRPGIETFLARSSWVSLTGGFHLNYRYSVDYSHENTMARGGDFVRWHYNARTAVTRIGLNFSENLLFRITDKCFVEVGSGIGITSIMTNRWSTEFTFQELTFSSNLLGGAGYSPYLYSHFTFSYRIGK